MAALSAWLVVHATGPLDGDYMVHGRAGADNAGPPIAAIVHGHLAHLPAVQTVMGLTSILLRVPFVAIATVLGMGARGGYIVGAIVCVATIVGPVAWIAAREWTRRQLALAAAAGSLAVLSPDTAGAIMLGHPEELLTAVLAVSALIAARSGRVVGAGALLGLAVGSKEWALFMAPVVVLALPVGRVRATAVALAVAGALTATLPLLDLGAFHRAEVSVGPMRAIYSTSVWWPIGVLTHGLPLGFDRADASIAALAVAGALIALAGWGLHSARADRRIDLMALLALIGLLRCLCDPSDAYYYLVAAVVPLVVWETGVLRRVPVASLLLWGLQALCFSGTMPFGDTRPILSGDVAAGVFITGALTLAAYLTARAFGAVPTAVVAAAPVVPADHSLTLA